MRAPPSKPAQPTPVDFGSDRTAPGILDLDSEGRQIFDGQPRRPWLDALLAKLRERRP